MDYMLESRGSEGGSGNTAATEQAGPASEAGYQGRVPGLVW